MFRSSIPSDPDDRQRFIAEQEASRAAAQEAQRLEAAIVLLEQALRATTAAGLDVTRLNALVDSARDRLSAIEANRGGRIYARTRPTNIKQWAEDELRGRYQLFIDESGGSRLNLTPSEPFFAVGGVLIADSVYEELEARWLEWKNVWIGRANATMHARHLSRKHIRYYIRKDVPVDEALSSLDDLIQNLDFSLYVMGINKLAFQSAYGKVGVDRFLPGTHYDMCPDFLLERVLNYLSELGDAYADVLAESRGRLEDAKLQMEYQRLQLEGTLFQPPNWFRHQLGPHISFRSKQRNVAGLQLIDILLRSVVDRLNDSASEPLRWRVARNKLFEKVYEDGRRRVRGWGLKIFPHDHDYVERVLAQR